MNMREVVPDAVQRMMALPVVGLDEAADDFDVVKGFLTRFGYLPDTAGAAASGEAGTVGVEDESADVLDEVTSMALAQYQTQHGLPATGIFDDATREMASRARCGFPDVVVSAGPEFSTTCAWTRNSLTYASTPAPPPWRTTVSVTPCAERSRRGPLSCRSRSARWAPPTAPTSSSTGPRPTAAIPT